MVGCSAAPHAAAPHPTGSASTACTSLIAALPDNVVLGQHRRATSPASPFTAAFGSPAVIVRCGVTVPSFNPEDDVEVVNGIGWLQLSSSHNEEHLLSWETRPVLEVDIPHHYLPADILPALSPAITRYATVIPGAQ